MWILMMAMLVIPVKVPSASFQEVLSGVSEVYLAVLTEDGKVDYSLLHRRKDLQQKLQDYSKFIAELDPDSIQDDQLKMAIYANAYNVLTLLGVNRAYPVPSVSKIRPSFGFFTEAEWIVGGKPFSLNDIEKKFLRPIDPRIHFIINCASASCPKLQRSVLTRMNIENLMEKAIREFLSDKTKNEFLAEGEWHLSKIFEWYMDDWGGKESMVHFILSYRTDLKEPGIIKHLEYDWTLNEKK